MAVLGTMNTLQVIRQVEFGVYLDGDQYGDILLPNREMPQDTEVELEDWLNESVLPNYTNGSHLWFVLYFY